ncbi:MAG TPA: hypothetical protein DHV36_11895 [Desulfobacteraceae bacterium]|nr:hypothetical protein [Desulfobacteraceae bacterium]|tara:strand:+ start:465 stop:1109 length:645 start_codon:yes stop_codon:yes gene_type:complete
MYRIIAICLLALSLLFTTPVSAFDREQYLIDGRAVLMYKTINWWYTCLSTDAKWLCGRPVVFRSRMGLIARPVREGLDIIIPDGTADLIALSPAAEAQDGSSPVHQFKLAWQHPEVFPKSLQLPSSLTGRQIQNGRIPVRRITETDKSRLKAMVPLMGIEIRGSITGLVDNRITLYPVQPHETGVERRCPCATPAVFLLTRSGEPVARYEIIPD